MNLLVKWFKAPFPVVLFVITLVKDEARKMEIREKNDSIILNKCATPVTCCVETSWRYCGRHKRRHPYTNLLICWRTYLLRVERHVGNKCRLGETCPHSLSLFSSLSPFLLLLFLSHVGMLADLWRHHLVHTSTANMSPNKSLPPCLLRCSSTTEQLVTQPVSPHVPIAFCHWC